MIVCQLLDPVVVAYLLHIGSLHWLPIFVFAYWLPGALFKALLSQVEEKLSFEVLAYRGPLDNNGFCSEGDHCILLRSQVSVQSLLMPLCSNCTCSQSHKLILIWLFKTGPLNWHNFRTFFKTTLGHLDNSETTFSQLSYLWDNVVTRLRQHWDIFGTTCDYLAAVDRAHLS